jgi:hypothetical protein
MRRYSIHLILFFIGFAFMAEAKEPLTFEKDIRPIFRAHCYDCHGAADEMKGALDLRLVRFMRKGGESGPAIIPGEPDQSYLLQRVKEGEMPPGESKVTAREIEMLQRWIAGGAVTARPEPETIGPGLGITPEERSHWSYQPISRPAPPEASTFGDVASRVRTPIDAFILKAMPEGLSFSPDTDRPGLVRRAYLNLTGLPPSPQAMEQWLKDEGEDWYDRLLTELLDSPHYGERWARHWLDVAGYADSEGATVKDAVRPWAWKYRDWVIRALNEDKPFDQFLVEQLAGDELAGPIQGDLSKDQIDLLTATGFLRMAADGTGSGANNTVGRNQVMTDTLKIVGTSLLGMSLQCAQCHDHRYDPIPQTDYYSLRAVFEPALDWQSWRTPQQRLVSLYTEEDRKHAAEIEAEAKLIDDEKKAKQKEYMAEALAKELTGFEEPLRAQLKAAYQTSGDKRTPEQKDLLAKNPSVNITTGNLYQYLPKAAEDLKKFDARIAEVRAKKTPEPFLRALVEPPDHVPETKLFFRGNPEQPKQKVAPAGLTVSAPDNQRHQIPLDDSSLSTTGRRLAFARWLTCGEHPLLARVMVNRVWMHHFGRGLVDTPSDFGKLGAPPTHPELLDWLADEFMRQGWSLKKLHRLILRSTVWRQGSRVSSELGNAAYVTLDPGVRYYWRKPLVRLEAEAIRDRMLAATGDLDRKLFGSPVGIKEDDAGQVIVDGPQTRRSIYIQTRRSRPVAMLQSFDAPVMETNCEKRPDSTAATQSLMLLNGAFALEQSIKLAERAAREAEPVSDALLADLPALPEIPGSVWQFGYGGFDAENGQTRDFTMLPHWTGSAWQGGPKLPDPGLGWALLTATGGHPDVPERSVIRRWIAPASGMVRLKGSLQHSAECGNGVRGRVIVSRSGVAGEWVACRNTVETAVKEMSVERGDIIDFMTDGYDGHSCDSFNWPVTITLERGDESALEFASEAGLHGPVESAKALPGQVVRAWQLALNREPTRDELQLATGFLVRQLDYYHVTPASLPPGRTAARQSLANLCQSLLGSNEFLYMD